MKKSNAIGKDIYISWLILASFYLYQYILRSSPGVLIEEIRLQFGMDAKSFAIMGSVYYCAYSLMQIPLGILVDRVGVRRTALWSIALCIIGTILLATTNILAVAYFSRFIVGIGSASAFMTSLKLAHDYLPASKQGLIIGATLTFGAVGALITGEPLNYLLGQFEAWQSSFIVFALVGFLLLAFAFIYLPKNKTKIDIHEFEVNNIWHDIIEIITNKKIIIYTILAISLYTPLLVVADFWGTAFLVAKFSLSREVASPILMNIYVGMAVGAIILPYFAKKNYTLDKMIISSTFLLLILLSTIIYTNHLTNGHLIILLLLTGFFCGAEMLCFTAALRYTNSHTSGLTIGVMNSFNMFSGAVMQQAIGFYLDFSWQGELNGQGLRIYSRQEFVEAFSILIAIMTICILIAFVTLGNKNLKKTNNE